MSWQEKQDEVQEAAFHQSLVDRMQAVADLVEMVEAEANAYFRTLPSEHDLSFEHPGWSYAKLTGNEQIDYDADIHWRKALYNITKTRSDFAGFVTYFSEAKDQHKEGSGMLDDYERTTEGLRESFEEFFALCDEEEFEKEGYESLSRLQKLQQKFIEITDLKRPFQPAQQKTA